MKTLEALIAHLEADENVRRFRVLEQHILNHPSYQEKYAEVIKRQKSFVQAQQANRKHAQAAETAYQEALAPLINDPLINEYLHLQAELNETLQMISQLIEAALIKPFNV